MYIVTWMALQCDGNSITFCPAECCCFYYNGLNFDIKGGEEHISLNISQF